MDSWLWNLMPLGIVKWAGRRWSGRWVVQLGDVAFPVAQCGGVLIRTKIEYPER